MYNNKLVVAIKHNGKILREIKDLVVLPFGSEFSILVKNLNSRRAKFKLYIDGTDVLDGEEIIVNANNEVEMKRFIRNKNMSEGNAFKFVQRTQAIEDGPRGIKIDDGIIRVEFWFEKEKPQTVIHNTIYNDYYNKRIDPWNTAYPPIWCSSATDTAYGTPSVITNSVLRGTNSNTHKQSVAIATSVTELSANIDTVTDVGITVPGSKVEQTFTPVYGFNSETESHVIILKMAGTIGETEITKPVTVKSKQKCETCAKVNKMTSSYCSACGSALTII